MRSIRLRSAGFSLLVVFGLALLRFVPGSGQEGNQDEKVELGARLYAENCAVCHGPDGKGRIGATLAKDWPSIRPDLRIKATITNGVPGSVMPAWSQSKGGPLTEEDIDALIAYILTWETGGPPLILPTPTFIPREILTPLPDVTGDPNHGAVLFDQNCAVCHGPNGEGRIGATLAKDWPSIRPDLRIKATLQRGVEGSVMPAWSQEFGGPLTDQDINDLVAFIMTWSTPENPPTITPAPSPTTLPRLQVSSQQVWVILFLIGVVLVVGAALAALSRK